MANVLRMTLDESYRPERQQIVIDLDGTRYRGSLALVSDLIRSAHNPNEFHSRVAAAISARTLVHEPDPTIAPSFMLVSHSVQSALTARHIAHTLEP